MITLHCRRAICVHLFIYQAWLCRRIAAVRSPTLTLPVSEYPTSPSTRSSFVESDMGSYLSVSVKTFLVGFHLAIAMEASQPQPGTGQNPIVAAAAGGRLGDFPAAAAALGGRPESELVATWGEMVASASGPSGDSMTEGTVEPPPCRRPRFGSLKKMKRPGQKSYELKENKAEKEPSQRTSSTLSKNSNPQVT